jgi:hypothetical protein
LLPSEFRTAVGRGRLPMMTSKFRRRSQASTCGEFNTLLVTDWLAHTPPEVLAKNFGVPVDTFKNIPVHNKWIYQSNIPAPPLATVAAQMAAAAGNDRVPLQDVRPEEWRRPEGDAQFLPPPPPVELQQDYKI